MNNILINKKSRQLVHILYSARPEIDLENSERLGKGGGGGDLQSWNGKKASVIQNTFLPSKGVGEGGEGCF